MRICKKPEERKLEITEAALELFLEKGYENVSIKDITNKVQVASGLFHYYFHSKEEVLMECVRLDRKNFIEELNRSQYLNENRSAVEKINYLMSRAVQNIMERSELIQNVWYVNSGMLMNQIKLEVLGAISDMLAEFITQGNEEGVFDCKYPRAVAEIAVFGLNQHFMNEQERDASLRQYLLGEYIYMSREKLREIFMGALNMKEPNGLLEFPMPAAQEKSKEESL